ncbi:MAG TPA: hypothetical protein VHD62_11195 [Opitutaceae bacterium]|nr:hypothetical protein [Opitutaceae bacterium]
MDKKLDALLGMVAGLQREMFELRTSLARDLANIMSRVNNTNTPPSPTQIAKDALTVAEFLDELDKAGVKRERKWVYKQIRLRRIRVLPVGLPHHISRSELLKLVTTGGAA